MDDKLKSLISYCEEEKIRLQTLISEYLKEEEYLLAHYHSNALYKLNQKLRILHNLDDQLYDDKQFQLNMISYYERQEEKTDIEEMKGFFLEKYLKAKEKLEKLKPTTYDLLPR